MKAEFDLEKKVWKGISIPYPFTMDYMLGNAIYENLQKYPDKVLQIEELGGSILTCRDLRINSIRIAQNLSKIGIIEDDVVSLFIKQSNFATCFINACVFIGAIINPLDAELDEGDIQHLISQTKPKIIICENDDIPKIDSILKKMDIKIPIYATSDKDTNFHSIQDFLKATNKEDEFKIPIFSKPSNEKILAILCSSGTTGRPKGVCNSHASCLAYTPLFSASTESVSLCYSPLYWSSGFFRNILTGITLFDVPIVTSKKFNVDNFIEICEKYKVTSITMPPSHLSVLLNSEKFLSTKIESLTTFMVGGAIISNSLRKKFEQYFPDKNMLVAYGMTETSAVISLPMEYKKKFAVGSMIFPNNLIKIVDEDGRNLDNGQSGEICVKMQFKFLGYYNNPDETQNAFDHEGYVKTGDIGYFDENGMLYVNDRKKDILKYKGFHINPSDIEDIIQSIKGVQHAAVVGIPDDFCYNLLAAGVVKLQGYEDLTEKDIADYVASRLPEQKHLHGGVYFYNELPMTLSGKIQKHNLLEKIQQSRVKMDKSEYPDFRTSLKYFKSLPNNNIKIYY